MLCPAFAVDVALPGAAFFAGCAKGALVVASPSKSVAIRTGVVVKRKRLNLVFDSGVLRLEM